MKDKNKILKVLKKTIAIIVTVGIIIALGYVVFVIYFATHFMDYIG